MLDYNFQNPFHNSNKIPQNGRFQAASHISDRQTINIPKIFKREYYRHIWVSTLNILAFSVVALKGYLDSIADTVTQCITKKSAFRFNLSLLTAKYLINLQRCRAIAKYFWILDSMPLTSGLRSWTCQQRTTLFKLKYRKKIDCHETEPSLLASKIFARCVTNT